MKELVQVPSSKFKVQGSKSRNLEPGTWNLEHAAAAWPLGTVLIAAMLLFPVAVSAQGITIDPTRPPVGYLATGADAGADSGEGDGGPVLQSVMISPTQRTAIINGALVKVGEKYGDAVLTRVAESEVVLRSGGVNRVLKLYPRVDKREAGQGAAVAMPPRGTGRDAGAATGGGASTR